MNATIKIERITSGPRQGWFRVVEITDNGFAVIGERSGEADAVQLAFETELGS